MPLPSLTNIGSIMKKVNDAAVVIAAGVALMAATDLENADKKKVLMDALNSLEGDFKIDIPDTITSIIIEVLLAVGKRQGWISANSSATTKK